MDPEEFTKLEYSTLREEIRDTKDRIFKLGAVALIGLPTASAAAEVLKIDILVLALPGFIVATIFLYLSESSALMRCGTYIKHRIEPDGCWEHWLADTTKDNENRRRVDKMAFWFFVTVFLLYYLAAAYLAILRAWSFGLPWGV
jgi:hypothetical protein